MDLSGCVLSGLFNYNHLKVVYSRTIQGPMSTLSDSKQEIYLWIKVLRVICYEMRCLEHLNMVWYYMINMTEYGEVACVIHGYKL